jgi:A/G-specific adenine glycosylase
MPSRKRSAVAAGTLARRLLAWYDRSGRDLPWRRTRDPYRILVSEVLLQQTPVARALPVYRRFVRRFPSLRALGRASLGQVLVEWGSLGYPRRARDLHRLARATPGRLPRDVAALDALPGVGPYTAGAVACFSAGAPVAFADTNIRRVLGRVAIGRTATEREALALDAALLPERSAARWHHALMDLGATVCVARAPRCAQCPVFALCASRGTDRAPIRRRQAPFAASDRRVRGAILRELRARPRMSAAALGREVGDDRVPRLIAALADEGLVERRGRSVSLPS